MKREILMQEKEKIERQYGAKKSTDGRFNQSVRSMCSNEILKEGDIISIPETYDIYNVVLNPDRPTPFIIVDVTNQITRESKKIQFFPNQLLKIVFPVDEDGKRLAKVETTGSVTKFYSQFNSVDDAMEFLKGKKIKVTNDTIYMTERFGDRQPVNTHIYQYDFAEYYVDINEPESFLQFDETKTTVIGVNDHTIEKLFIPLIHGRYLKIDKYAFCGCKNLHSIHFVSVTEILKGAFKDCTSLKRIDILEGPDKIDLETFSGCTALEEINVKGEKYHGPIDDEDIPAQGYCSTDGILYSQYHDSRKYTLSLIMVPHNHHSSNIILPNNVTRIARNAFRDCRNIRSVTLPYVLESCPATAFYGCDSLEKIIIPKYTMSRFERLMPECKHLLIEQKS